ncbi:LysR family transcriptional regulator [Raoultella planticola]|uniref:LysR family transcriptional regulator n=1 Tax=Raoultella planticola TaxID=575 RepID=UPI001A1E7FB5|nr:LysR family transcriptional regulator [Raoultella planticola]EJR0224987.1 LysR family transcriptional regulator [Raoultella planticola]EJR0354797.1 LysR family transcriptional regulator [Raoultella planticola]MDV1446701.1 LysR family transcriptional regulator [Raoultella planticola]MDV1563224.1 LysR family transcriptional regulator [Raoultella planticola]MDV1569560.1 LysR family transcriptional regulator [Raoultella planticola]
MNNKLNAIATFLRVAEAGSFSATARQSGMKQSAVSQQIAALEEELGVVLLHRTTRVMALTEQGESYRRDMQLLLEAMREAERRLNPADHQFQGRVHVQLPSGLGQIFMPHLLALQKRNPGLHLMLSLDDRIADLVTEGVDVALRLSHEPPQTHAARVLARIETALFAAPDFTPLHSVSELAMHPHVRFSAIPLEAPLRLVSGQNTLDVKVNTVFRANTSEALRQAIESGLGIGGMQLPLAARAVQSGRLVPVLPAWRLPDRFLYAVYPDARFIPQRVRSIISAIESLLPDITGNI